MREISHYKGISAEDAMSLLPPFVREIAMRIRSQKIEGTRPVPSSALIDQSRLLTPIGRRILLDKVASLVDENQTGRSDMCMQFAMLLALALKFLGMNAKAVGGAAYYYLEGQKVFSWSHAWVVVGGEIIDGNTDSLYENPAIPAGLIIPPYWGRAEALPADRRMKRGICPLPMDADIDEVWWPDMKAWLHDTKFSAAI